jgi:tetratricopeptide (TPR) repeat protein
MSLTDNANQLFDRAFALHQAGKLEAARALYLQSLALSPKHGHALHSLGLIAFSAGRFQEAREFFKRATKALPQEGVFFNSLGLALQALGKSAAAVESFRSAVSLRPQLMGAWQNLGALLSALGRMQEAAEALSHARNLQTLLADSHNAHGTSLMHQRKFEEAAAAFRDAIACNPNSAPAYSHLANALAEVGRVDEAIPCLLRSLQLQPASAETRVQLSRLLCSKGDISAAIEQCKQAIILKPAWAVAHMQFGNLLWQSGVREEAIQALQTAVALAPDSQEAQRQLASARAAEGIGTPGLTPGHRVNTSVDGVPAVLGAARLQRDRGELEGAEVDYRRACALEPDNAALYEELGALLKMLGKFDEAIVTWKRAALLDAKSSAVVDALGVIHFDRGEFTDAEQYFRQAVQRNPLRSDHQGNLGCALRAQCRFDEALACFASAVALSPQSALAWFNLGNLQAFLKQLDTARASLTTACHLEPQNAVFHVERAQLLLRRGEFEEGWQEYEWRPSAQRLRTEIQTLKGADCPQWRGEPLKGKKLLIRAEQGFGDTIQFFRYVECATQSEATVTFECPAPLARLLRNNTRAQVIEAGTPLDTFDFYTPLMSLPHTFGVRLDRIQRTQQYILADRTLMKHWSSRTTHRGGLRVGVVWAGGHRPWSANGISTDRERSVEFAQLEPILDIPEVVCFSLQLGEAASQAGNAIESGRLINWMRDCRDFADTAALIANLDLVVSVDTAVAHLSAAMGKPTWILSRLNGCWRWLEERVDSPWYPTVRLFRQTTRGHWGDVVAQLRNELRDFANRTYATTMHTNPTII